MKRETDVFYCPTRIEEPMDDDLWKILLMKYIEMSGRLNIVKIPFHGLKIGAK